MLNQSIIVYTLILFIMGILAKVASRRPAYINYHGIKKENKFATPEIIMMIAFFAFMSGIRFDVGTDYISYLTKYIDGEASEGRMEYLFQSISKIFYQLKIHAFLYFAVWAAIQIIFFLLAFKKERYLYPYLIFFLIVLGTYQSWMNIIRNEIAICIWLYAIQYIHERRFKKYIFWCFVAILFHKSAIILVIFYPLLKGGKDYFKSIPLQLILFTFAFIIRYSFQNYFNYFEGLITIYQQMLGGDSGTYDVYSSNMLLDQLNSGKEGGTGYAWLFKTFIWITILVYSKKLKLFYNSKRFNIMYFFFFIGLLINYVLPPTAIVLSRPFRYFYEFQFIMISFFAYYLLKSKKEKYNKMILCITITGCLGLFYLNQITGSIDSHSWFQFFFQHPEYRYIPN